MSEQDLDVAKFIKKFEFHPSIVSIKRHVKVEVMFDYRPITEEEMGKKITALDHKKNGGCIPTKLLKDMCHIVKKPLTDVWNDEIIKNKTFSSKLKLRDITPVFKALQNTVKKNIGP